MINTPDTRMPYSVCYEANLLLSNSPKDITITNAMSTPTSFHRHTLYICNALAIGYQSLITDYLIQSLKW